MSNFGRRSTAEDVLAGQDLEGKTIMLTGCASGIGFESMRALAAKGATVIGAARTQEKAEKACNSVKGKCIPIACEHSDFDSISQAISAVRKLDTDIDVIIANAGIMTPKTPDTR
ncbi:MAG: SDR family NAD(P)-dependent oxidoreductase [Cellvibrionaceae bacterium]|nr:SDR family NAD(P)-dependent oxidoreductase [Cellvibrionaceae bacterium]